jgi:hypothetical protein
LSISYHYSTWLSTIFSKKKSKWNSEKIWKIKKKIVNKGNNKITELRTILQRESQTSKV